MVSLALDLSLEAIVAGEAKALKIVGVEEERGVAEVAHDVVRYSGLGGATTGKAEGTQWLVIELGFPKPTPLSRLI